MMFFLSWQASHAVFKASLPRPLSDSPVTRQSEPAFTSHERRLRQIRIIRPQRRMASAG
jgi:hypothetical protein